MMKNKLKALAYVRECSQNVKMQRIKMREREKHALKQ